MAVWDIDEYDLTLLHMDKRFHAMLLTRMDYWLRRTIDVRNQILLNATDRTRKDQWVWMQRYEDMLVQFVGETARFLPGEAREGKREQVRNRVEPDDEPDDGLISITT